MAIYLGLGANLGDRLANLARALDLLEADGVRIARVSPVVESPAMLPENAPDGWNRPFFNLVAECAFDGSAEALLERCKAVERALGRDDPARWSPRPIDVDILLHGHDEIASGALTVPHPGLTERSFALVPLAAIAPGLTIPGRGHRTALEWTRTLAHRMPLWMGIVNLTPDSFSDGGRFVDWPEVERHVDEMVGSGAHIIDLGAESTRPGATPLTAHEELARLEPVLERLIDKYRDRRLKPLVSVDTYHADVARRALDLGTDIVNDVSGLTDPGMIELAAAGTADFVAMHQLTLPADPRHVLPPDGDPVDAVERWLVDRLEAWRRAGIDLDRVVFDPGVGFGKTAYQSLRLLRECARFERYGLRQLVGHSRKSFLAGFAGRDMAARDLNTLGISLELAGRGVEILRVHNVAAHTAAYRGWVHALPLD